MRRILTIKYMLDQMRRAKLAVMERLLPAWARRRPLQLHRPIADCQGAWSAGTIGLCIYFPAQPFGLEFEPLHEARDRKANVGDAYLTRDATRQP